MTHAGICDIFFLLNNITELLKMKTHTYIDTKTIVILYNKKIGLVSFLFFFAHDEIRILWQDLLQMK